MIKNAQGENVRSDTVVLSNDIKQLKSTIQEQTTNYNELSSAIKKQRLSVTLPIEITDKLSKSIDSLVDRKLPETMYKSMNRLKDDVKDTSKKHKDLYNQLNNDLENAYTTMIESAKQTNNYTYKRQAFTDFVSSIAYISIIGVSFFILAFAITIGFILLEYQPPFVFIQKFGMGLGFVVALTVLLSMFNRIWKTWDNRQKYY